MPLTETLLQPSGILRLVPSQPDVSEFCCLRAFPAASVPASPVTHLAYATQSNPAGRIEQMRRLYDLYAPFVALQDHSRCLVHVASAIPLVTARGQTHSCPGAELPVGSARAVTCIF
jgi:hypothetical protein